MIVVVLGDDVLGRSLPRPVHTRHGTRPMIIPNRDFREEFKKQRTPPTAATAVDIIAQYR